MSYNQRAVEGSSERPGATKPVNYRVMKRKGKRKVSGTGV